MQLRLCSTRANGIDWRWTYKVAAAGSSESSCILTAYSLPGNEARTHQTYWNHHADSLSSPDSLDSLNSLYRLSASDSPDLLASLNHSLDSPQHTVLTNLVKKLLSASLAADIHTTVPFEWALRLWIQQLTLRLLCILTVEQRPFVFEVVHTTCQKIVREWPINREVRENILDLWATPAWTSTPRRYGGATGSRGLRWCSDNIFWTKECLSSGPLLYHGERVTRSEITTAIQARAYTDGEI